MTADLPDSALELRSLVTSQGTLELSLTMSQFLPCRR